jgi:hypothetical protein
VLDQVPQNTGITDFRAMGVRHLEACPSASLARWHGSCSALVQQVSLRSAGLTNNPAGMALRETILRSDAFNRRPRHHARAEGAIENFKKFSPPV